MLIAFGFAVAAHSWWTALALAVLFALIYFPTIRAEEVFLRERFTEYDEYAKRVPRLIPRLRPAGVTGDGVKGGGFSGELYRKHREYNAVLGTLGIYGVLLLKLFVWHRTSFLPL
jgi:hypothetical protein